MFRVWARDRKVDPPNWCMVSPLYDVRLHAENYAKYSNKRFPWLEYQVRTEDEE